MIIFSSVAVSKSFKHRNWQQQYHMKTLILPQRALQPFIFSLSTLRNLTLMLFLLLLVWFSPFHCRLALLVPLSGCISTRLVQSRYTFSGHSHMNCFSLWIPSTLFCPITFLSAVISPSSNQLYNLCNSSAPQVSPGCCRIMMILCLQPSTSHCP